MAASWNRRPDPRRRPTVTLTIWLRNLTSGASKTRRRHTRRLGLEALEARVVPSAAGDPLWTRQFGSTGSDYANVVSVGGSGVYVAGVTTGALPSPTNSGSTD